MRRVVDSYVRYGHYVWFLRRFTSFQTRTPGAGVSPLKGASCRTGTPGKDPGNCKGRASYPPMGRNDLVT